jgi:hypothetical protein
MQDAIAALRRVDFDWAAHVDQIWSDNAADISELQKEARSELEERIDTLRHSRSEFSPLGVPLLGAAGAGKTHLLGVLRRRALDAGMFFVLVDMTDVHNFWDTVLLGYLRSLQQPGHQGRRQLDNWLAGLLKRFGARVKRADSIPAQRPPGLINTCNEVIQAVRNDYRDKAQEHGDVLRALVLFACDHAEINDLGYKWLQGIGIDDDEKEHHGFRDAQRAPQRIVRGLSWLLSLEAPTVMALDQLDAIVAEHNLASSMAADEPAAQQQMSLSIIQGISGGLIALRDVTQRTLTVVSTLQATWSILGERSSVSMVDRYESPLHLDAVNPPDAAKRLISSRLAQAYRESGFVPPYAAYPFTDAFFEAHRANTPREILKACDAHRQRCKKAGRVEETSLGPDSLRPTIPVSGWKTAITERFEALQRAADLKALLADESEQVLDSIVEAACNALLVENKLSSDVNGKVEKEFLGTGNYDPLHARICLTLTNQGERERHHSFRFLQQSNCRAFQARLKAAITASGIDHAIGFRKLTILRRGLTPSGAATQELVKQFIDRGGRLLDPTDDELRLLWALSQLYIEEPPQFEEWLRVERPVSKTSSFGTMTRWLFEGLDPVPETEEASAREPLRETPTAASKAVVTKTGYADGKLVIGRQLVSGSPEQTVAVPLPSLSQHVCVFAGSGSGKTVFLKRLLEEAALCGVPSIVIDGANDLSRLGDPWPERPQSFSAEDAAKASRYHAMTEVVIWTPGRASGRALSFNPIPDFSAFSGGARDDEARDQLNAAVAMARSSLEPLVAPGKGAKDKKSQAILASALGRYAERGGGSVQGLIELLREPPEDVTDGYKDGEKIAKELSELLLSAIRTDPLLGGSGQSLDPEHLLRSNTPGKVRISVINLVGLPGQDSQQKFINQLAMTLFTWIKKNPAKNGALLGLLVIDEAKDFVPSGRSVACRDNVLRLAAQARKYGLGLLFATQAPKSIDHQIVANCSTLLLGKQNSPAAIDAAQQLLQEKGASGSDVGRLAQGTFYLSTAAHPKPIKVATSMCLSHHPPSPPDENEVLERARRQSG